MTKTGRVGLVGLVGLVLMPAIASGQDAPTLRAHHVTINTGLSWSGDYDIGVSTAKLRGNGTGPTPPPLTLLTAGSHVATATAPELRVGVALTPSIAIEGGASLSSPRIGVAISADPEAPSQELIGEELQQYVFDGGVTWQLPIRMGRRLAPFAAAGAGYLRQLHEDRTFAETGRIYYAGGGARYWLRGGHGATWALGVRGDMRVNFRTGGIDFENKMRAYPTFTLSAFLGL